MYDIDREEEESGIFKTAFLLLGIIAASVALFILAVVGGAVATVLLWG